MHEDVATLMNLVNNFDVAYILLVLDGSRSALKYFIILHANVNIYTLSHWWWNIFLYTK